MSDEENKSLINVKDLAGLSGPLTKLVETINNAGARVSDAVQCLANVLVLDKKRAENEAHRIRTVGAAETQTTTERAKAYMEFINGGQAQLQEMNFDGKEASAKLIGIPAEVKNLKQRVENRVMYENVLHQLNREAVQDFAAQALANEEDVSEEPVNPDWTARLFNISQEVSSEEMHALFGKILAGEIKKPGSFSLRTLEVVRNLTSNEAALLKKVAPFVCNSKGTGVLLTGLSDYDGEFLSRQGISHLDKVTLSDAGLLSAHDTVLASVTGPCRSGLALGNIAFIYEFDEEKKFTFKGLPLTSAGFNLFKLIVKDIEVNIEVIEEIGKKMFKAGVDRLSYGRVIGSTETGMLVEDNPTNLDYLKEVR
ncbi:DUF2806 domain-containing protein [Hymenobacter metallicola]|uniref:DUF2806 domain-containing protein n=1 Tax=Hymenobacter metallicola TaxID=2563114 RepID=A0A4Z0QIC2_9BACT|nr:DUF2806 domain-containing protein [Hymenobacter metallicola]TGE29750.1 DUF2806 domain-containing protein [Hymenobacter metallicola]